VTRRSWAKAHDAELLAFSRALAAAQEWLFSDRDGAQKLIGTMAPSLSDDELRQLYLRLTSPGALAPRAMLDIEGMSSLLQMREIYGEPKKKMGPVTRYVDPSYYERAMAKK
jgi:ABC-type nitrate/sulfonate/bicarbonate transport system substrate-binding protein